MDNNNYNNYNDQNYADPAYNNYNNQNYADPAYNNYNNQNYADPAYNNYNNQNYADPAYNNYNQNYAPAYNAVAPVQDTSGKALTFGILSLAFFATGLLGLIFAIIGKSNAKKYKENFGQPSGKSKTGSILSTIGLVFSIFFTSYYVLIFILGIIAGLSGM